MPNYYAEHNILSNIYSHIRKLCQQQKLLHLATGASEDNVQGWDVLLVKKKKLDQNSRVEIFSLKERFSQGHHLLETITTKKEFIQSWFTLGVSKNKIRLHQTIRRIFHFFPCIFRQWKRSLGMIIFHKNCKLSNGFDFWLMLSVILAGALRRFC